MSCRESDRNVEQFRGGLVFKAHRLVYHSTLGLGILKKKEEDDDIVCGMVLLAHSETPHGLEDPERRQPPEAQQLVEPVAFYLRRQSVRQVLFQESSWSR